VDCEGVEPMTRPFDASNRLDEDVPGPTIPVATITAAAPASEGPFIAVPKVLADAS
ncbi:MAG: Asp-tRNA(Asn)/Glu-tRNA(Gln) amidotransferase subunit GatC, partial [Phycisphaerales bacterium]